MKMTVFWDVAPCSLVEIDRGFRSAYCLHHRPDSGGRSTSETSVNFYQMDDGGIDLIIEAVSTSETWGNLYQMDDGGIDLIMEAVSTSETSVNFYQMDDGGIALITEAGSTSETSASFYQTKGAKSQKTVIFSIRCVLHDALSAAQIVQYQNDF
jgi:hypothetical protein